MALQKSVTTDQSISANYHRISNFKMYFDANVVEFDVDLYVDAAARSGGSSSLASTSYAVTDADYTTYFAPAALDVVNQNPQERAYEWLKTQTTPVDFTTGTTDV